ncbi:MAG: class I SAM-dependent methyltransferase [bacterium]
MDMYKLFEGLKALEISGKYYDICAEYAQGMMGEDDSGSFDQFVIMFFRSGSSDMQGYYRNVFAQRHKQLIEKLIEKGSGAKVLDACCGMGYDSILLALAGGDVIGVDLSDEKIETAEKLKKIFLVRHPEMKLKFFNRDIFSFFEEKAGRFSGYFDIIWVTEGISHIHPMEEFLKTMKRCLKPEGYLIISESNILNPIVRFNLRKRIATAYSSRDEMNKHKVDSYYLHKDKALDPVTNSEVTMANERMVSHTWLSRILKKVGYKVQKTIFRTYLPAGISKYMGIQIINSIESILQSVPFLKLMGIRYIVIASAAGV